MSDKDEIVQPEQLDDEKNNKKNTDQAQAFDEVEKMSSDEATKESQNSTEVPINDIDGLQNQITVLEQQVKDNLDKAMRAQAELDNVRKRATRDVENAHKYALEKFLNDLLPVLDSMELGMNAASSAEDIESLREGMDLTLKQFSSVMEKFGIHEVNPQGEKFNPEFHEAVSMQELEGAESGTVTAVMQKGYELNGRLIRPAMVAVAK